MMTFAQASRSVQSRRLPVLRDRLSEGVLDASVNVAAIGTSFDPVHGLLPCAFDMRDDRSRLSLSQPQR